MPENVGRGRERFGSAAPTSVELQGELAHLGLVCLPLDTTEFSSLRLRHDRSRCGQLIALGDPDVLDHKGAVASLQQPTTRSEAT